MVVSVEDVFDVVVAFVPSLSHVNATLMVPAAVDPDASIFTSMPTIVSVVGIEKLKVLKKMTLRIMTSLICILQIL